MLDLWKLYDFFSHGKKKVLCVHSLSLTLIHLSIKQKAISFTNVSYIFNKNKKTFYAMLFGKPNLLVHIFSILD